MAWPRAVATAAACLTGVLLVAAGGFAVAAPSGASAANLAFGLVVAPLSVTLGVLVTRRRGNPAGAYLALVGVSVAAVSTREVLHQFLAARAELAQSLSWLVAALAESAWWVLAAVALLLLHFPDGRLPSRRWRWVAPVILVCVTVNQVYGAVERAPFRPPLESLARPFGPPPPWFDVLSLGSFVAMLGLSLACAVSLVLRYRRSAALQRRQIRWLAVSGLFVVAYPLLCLIEILAWGEPRWPSVVVGLTGLIGLPLTTGVAMLRHDLYDVDRAIAGTVTWSLVTATLVALYATASVIAGVVLGRESTFAAAVATAVGALALHPVRSRLQTGVDRRLYPLRRAAFEAIELLHRDITSGRATPEQLETVLRAALRDPALRVGYRLPGQDRYVCADGSPVTPGEGGPVECGGTQVGVILSGSTDLTSELLRQVAAKATPAVEMVRLRLELAQALREVETSRSRLVQIGYEERRRLERDLHDGAQQRLVSLGMAIRLAQRHLDDGTVDVDELLDECVAELGTAVAELRQLAHGLRPSSLDDGLPAAVARLVRGVPVAVELRVEDSALPDDIATTAYFVISEALANAVKHAQASRIELDVHRLDGTVVVRVSDDGRGGASLSPRSGLADRVAALGGSLQVASPPGSGTVVEAELPCAS